jgi:hypothetical protein
MLVVSHMLGLRHVLDVMNHMPQGFEQAPERLVPLGLALRHQRLMEAAAGIAE